MVIPPELLARFAEPQRNQACICRDCVNTFHRSRTPQQQVAKLSPGDFYFESGIMVFTAQYHLKRGYCCGNGCRHCPYRKTGSSLG